MTNRKLSDWYPTYTAVSTAFTPGTAPQDVFSITGSATMNVYLMHASISTIQTTAGVNAWFLTKRSTANSGGTSATPAIVPLSSNNGAAIDFTGLSTAYINYVVYMDNVKLAADVTSFIMRVSVDNGSTYIAANYTGASLGYLSSAATAHSTAVASAQMTVSSAATMGNAANEDLSGMVTIFNPATAGITRFTMQTTYLNGAGNTAITLSGYNYNGATTAVDAIRFLAGSGNITSGEFRLYGVKNA